MTIKITCICDFCKKDLTYTNNGVDWRISIKSERMNSDTTNPVTLMYIPPQITDEMHFVILIV